MICCFLCSKRIQKTVQQRKLRLHMDSSVSVWPFTFPFLPWWYLLHLSNSEWVASNNWKEVAWSEVYLPYEFAWLGNIATGECFLVEMRIVAFRTHAWCTWSKLILEIPSFTGQTYLYMWLSQEFDPICSREATQEERLWRRFERDGQRHHERAGERARCSWSGPLPAANQHSKTLQTSLQSSHQTRIK